MAISEREILRAEHDLILTEAKEESVESLYYVWGAVDLAHKLLEILEDGKN